MDIFNKVASNVSKFVRMKNQPNCNQTKLYDLYEDMCMELANYFQDDILNKWLDSEDSYLDFDILFDRSMNDAMTFIDEAIEIEESPSDTDELSEEQQKVIDSINEKIRKGEI